MNISPLIFINKYFNYIIKVLIIFLIITLISMVLMIKNSPEDYLQGYLILIMYIHVPAAWISVIIYSLIALLSFMYVIFKNIQFYAFARILCNVGIVYTLTALVTGSIWGKPAWGTWWVWDARLTSMLFLFFIYIGYKNIIDYSHNQKTAYIASFYAVSCFIIIPLIKFSVNLWTTLHQPSSIFKLTGISIHYSIFRVLIVSLLFHIFYILMITALLVKNEYIKRKIHALSMLDLNKS